MRSKAERMKKLLNNFFCAFVFQQLWWTNVHHIEPPIVLNAGVIFSMPFWFRNWIAPPVHGAKPIPKIEPTLASITDSRTPSS